MGKTVPHLIPSIYLSGYLDGFEGLVGRYPVSPRSFARGDFLTRHGVINNTAFYVRSGVIQLSLGHDRGEKALNLFGPGTVFPIGVETHEYLMEYEMIIRAFADAETYAMPYPLLRKIVRENGEFAGELLRENCDFIGYLFFDALDQAFEPCLTRVCDVLYLYLTKVRPAEPVVPMSQAELARVAGASQAQMERSLRLLRDEGALVTARGQIQVLDVARLRAHCSLNLR